MTILTSRKSTTAFTLILVCFCLVACGSEGDATPTVAPLQAITPPAGLDPLEDLQPSTGEAFFVAANYTRAEWTILLNDHKIILEPYPPGKGVSFAIYAINPGEYAWQATTPLEPGRFLTDAEGEPEQKFTLQAGQIYFARILSLNPATSTLRYWVDAQILE